MLPNVSFLGDLVRLGSAVNSVSLTFIPSTAPILLAMADSSAFRDALRD